MRLVVLLLVVGGIGCRSERASETAVTANAAARSQGDHQHECLAEAEREWALRQRELQRSEVEVSAFAAPGVHSERDSAFTRSQVGSMADENASSDLALTHRIRRALFAEQSLSFAAKNVKILTSAGRVTLRGALRDQGERAAVEEIAKRVAGETNVVSEL